MPKVSKELLDTFDQLDLTIGNGLIGKNQLVAPASKALFIGLGGTGTDALRRLKRIVYQRYKDIDRYFAFLGIDTDDREPTPHNNYLTLSANEKVLITHENGRKFFGERSQLPDHITEWLSPNVKLSDTTKGAGSFRQAGRALLFHNAGMVTGAIRGAFERIMRGAGGAFVEVFILSGVGGGTGSGSMLDVAYMVRGVAGRIPTDQYNIHGYIFMPDINAAAEGLPQVARDALRPNAYAALKEIDYWMNIEARKDVFVQKYDATFSVESKQPPFNLCFPLSTQNSAGQVLEDAYMESMTVAAETICQFISYKGDNEQGDTFVQSFIANTHRYAGDRMDALLQQRQTMVLPVHNKYTVCGSSIRRLPVAAINTYLACLLFRRIRSIYENCKNKDIPAMIPVFCGADGLQIDSVSLRERVTSMFAERGISIPNFGEWPFDSLFRSSATEDQYNDYNRRLSEAKTEIQTALSDEIQRRLEDEFHSMFIDTERGPYFVNVFIQNDTTGLIAQLDSYKNNAQIEVAECRGRASSLSQEAELTRSNGTGSLALMKKNHIRNYSSALHNRFSNRRNEEAAKCCEEIYASVNERLQKRVNASYKATYDILQALMGIFETNMETFSAEVKRDREPGKVVYSWDIFTLPEIVEIVEYAFRDKGISRAQIDATVSGFFKDLYDLIDRSIRRNDIAGDADFSGVEVSDVNVIEFMAQFLSERFDFLVDQTIGDYLERKAALNKKDFNTFMQELFQSMSQEALPLFNQSPDQNYWLRFAPLPNIRGTKVKEAWEVFAQGKNNQWAQKPSVSRDTFVFMTVGCGAMLYESDLLDTAERDYDRVKEGAAISASLHLNRAIERRDASGRMIPYTDEEIKINDWLYLPPVRPLDERSEVGKYGEQEANARIIIKRLYDKGVIRRAGVDNVTYSIARDSARKPILFSRIAATLGGDKINRESPVGMITEYRGKITELRKYITGDADVPHNLLDIYGIQFLIDRVTLEARRQEEWTGIEEKPMYVMYARSLNIQRDTRNIEVFLDDLGAELARVNEIMQAFEQTERMATLVVHGFRCGKFIRNGNVFQFVKPDGEAETLARAGGVDKYPVFALYERYKELKNREKLDACISEAYMKAVDDDTFDTVSYEALKAQINKDDAKADERSEETTDQCKLFIKYVLRAIGDIDED